MIYIGLPYFCLNANLKKCEVHETVTAYNELFLFDSFSKIPFKHEIESRHKDFLSDLFSICFPTFAFQQ